MRPLSASVAFATALALLVVQPATSDQACNPGCIYGICYDGGCWCRNDVPPYSDSCGQTFSDIGLAGGRLAIEVLLASLWFLTALTAMWRLIVVLHAKWMRGRSASELVDGQTIALAFGFLSSAAGLVLGAVTLAEPALNQLDMMPLVLVWQALEFCCWGFAYRVFYRTYAKFNATARRLARVYDLLLGVLVLALLVAFVALSVGKSSVSDTVMLVTFACFIAYNLIGNLCVTPRILAVLAVTRAQLLRHVSATESDAENSAHRRLLVASRGGAIIALLVAVSVRFALLLLILVFAARRSRTDHAGDLAGDVQRA
mgnify:CR=1 FL=1